MSIYWLILIVIGVLLVLGMLLSSRRRGNRTEVVSLASFLEAEAMLARNRLLSEGIWAEVRHAGGIGMLGRQSGSTRAYQLIVRLEDVRAAQSILGMPANPS